LILVALMAKAAKVFLAQQLQLTSKIWPAPAEMQHQVKILLPLEVLKIDLVIRIRLNLHLQQI